MKKLVALSCAALALNGCALLPRKIEYRYVSTYCVTREQFDQLKAAEPNKIHSQLDGNAEHDSKLLAGSNVRLRAFADGLLVVIGGCTEPDAHQIADKLLKN